MADLKAGHVKGDGSRPITQKDKDHVEANRKVDEAKDTK